jgi:release factor glutamine methyltransferase
LPTQPVEAHPNHSSTTLVHQLLKSVACALSEAGIEDAAIEAELLLRHCLSVSRSGLFLLHNQPITPEQKAHCTELLRRRCLREPLQYILGSCEFWSLDFLVTPAVLIPRPETEFLLHHVFSTLAAVQHRPQHALDLCTGSGVIAVTLAVELPAASLVATDCDKQALAVAQSNIRHHGMIDRIQLLCADLFHCFQDAAMFDLIVSNPPYIKSADIATLQPEVRDWEPHRALSGGSTGMDRVEAICAEAAARLRPKGWLFMEIGADIGAETERALTAAGQYEAIRIIPDWAGHPRVAQARKRS